MIKHVEIEYKSGSFIRGYLNMPNSFNGEIVLMLHGFTGNKTEHGFMFRDFSREIAKYGFASLRMDFSGNGESDGEFNEFNLTAANNEIRLMVEFIKKLENVVKIDFLGFSMGGSLAALNSSIYNPHKLILWSPAGNMKNLIKTIYEKVQKDQNGDALYLRDFKVSRKFYEDALEYDPYNNNLQFTNNVFICIGDKDISVPYDAAKRYNETFINSSFELIKGAGHGYDNENGKETLFKKTLDFLLS